MDVLIYSAFSCNVMQFQICMIAQQIKGHISFRAAFKERGSALFWGMRVVYLILSLHGWRDREVQGNIFKLSSHIVF